MWISGSEDAVPVGDEPVTEIEHLGEVSTASGDLALIDFGLLALWSGDDAPILRPGMAPDETIRIANGSVDVVVSGPDAERLTGALDAATAHGRFIFDLPPAFAASVRDRLEDARRRHGFRAEVTVLEHRIPHLERVRRLLADAPDGTEVPYHGVWAVGLRGIPRVRSLEVLGRRMDPDGPDEGRWWSVWVECAPGRVARSERAGYVMVDEARLMWADPAALGVIRIEADAGDLVDIAFWGRDAESLASGMGATSGTESGGQVYGWDDLTIDEARRLIAELERREADGARFVFDVRPHNDLWKLLGQARSSTTGSGTIRAGSTRACGFFTSWGDGAFPVYRDLDESGGLLRVRVELGSPEIVERTRQLEERWFGPFAKLAIVSTRVTREDRPVSWLYREAPDHDDDSGWRVFAGDETEAFVDDPANAEVVPLRDLLDADPDLEAVLRTPGPCRFERATSGGFRVV